MADTQFTPASEIENRIGLFQKRLQAEELEAALLQQNTDLFYFTGTIQKGYLYLPAQGKPLLMVSRNLPRASRESPIERIVAIENSRRIPQIIQQYEYPFPRRIGLENDVLPANQYLKLKRLFDPAEIVDVSTAIRTTRAVKSAYEISQIREAAKGSDRIAAYMGEVLREGLTEIELAGVIEARARKLGHQGIVRMRLWGNEMFYGHLMAGPHAAQPSYLSSPTGGAGLNPSIAQGSSFYKIHRHEPVLLDYVFTHNGYLADNTRIFSIGDPPEELYRAHDAMLELHRHVQQRLCPGITAAEVYRLACEKALTLGYGSHFMGTDDHRVRFVGHGIGLELDEFPILGSGQSMRLKTGMVLALEPKVIFPGKGVVGIENTHLITTDGSEQLTRFNEAITII